MNDNEQAIGQGGGLAYKWIVAIVAITGVFMSVLDATIVNIAIPRLQTAFGADLHSVQFVSTAYILTQGVVTPTTAYFANRFGIKRFYIMALTAFTLGSALCGVAWSLPTLVVFRILQGLGGASLFPLSLSLLFREFPPEQRGVAMGLFGIPAFLAPALGPPLGGYLVTIGDWPLIFYINVPVGIFAIILTLVLLRESQREVRSRFDVPGFIFAACGLAALLYAFTEVGTYGWGSTTVLSLLIAGIIALGIFIAIELSTVSPLLDVRIFANRLYTISTIAYVLANFCLFGGLFLLPIYLQNLRGLSAFQTGLVLLPQAFASAVSVLLGGRLVDRVGVRAVVIPGLLILAFSSWQLSFLTLDSPYWLLQVMFVLRSFSLGFVSQPIIVAAMAEIRLQQLTQATSINAVMRSVTSSFGIALLATLVQRQTSVHYAHLAEQITASSPLGQLIPRLQALFVTHGASAEAARRVALQVIAGLVRKQSYVLAIQDAFRLTLVFIVLTLIVMVFVRVKRQPFQRRGQVRENVPSTTMERSTREEGGIIHSAPAGPGV